MYNATFIDNYSDIYTIPQTYVNNSQLLSYGTQGELFVNNNAKNISMKKKLMKQHLINNCEKNTEHINKHPDSIQDTSEYFANYEPHKLLLVDSDDPWFYNKDILIPKSDLLQKKLSESNNLPIKYENNETNETTIQTQIILILLSFIILLILYKHIYRK